MTKLWPFAQFRDASVPNALEAWSAYRHNRERRHVLLFPMFFWSVFNLFLMALGFALQECSWLGDLKPYCQAVWGIAVTWIIIVLVVMGISWVWLSGVEA